MIPNTVKNDILNKQEQELERNAQIARIKIVEQKIRDWDVPNLGFAGLRRLERQLQDLKGSVSAKSL